MQTLAIFSCRDSSYDKYINCIEIGYKFTSGAVGALAFMQKNHCWKVVKKNLKNISAALIKSAEERKFRNRSQDILPIIIFIFIFLLSCLFSVGSLRFWFAFLWIASLKLGLNYLLDDFQEFSYYISNCFL